MKCCFRGFHANTLPFFHARMECKYLLKPDGIYHSNPQNPASVIIVFQNAVFQVNPQECETDCERHQALAENPDTSYLRHSYTELGEFGT